MRMKTSLIRVAGIAVMGLLALPACQNRDAEKRIAELESRLADLEGKKATNPVPAQTTATPTPADEKPEGPLPVLQFEKIEHDFGTIAEGQLVEYTYKFKNAGEAPLIIQSAQPSCGCTVPDWSKEPIPAGGTGFVKASFDSNGKPDIQNKTIAVTANTWPKQTTLRFKAMVTPKAQAGTPTK